MKRQKAKRVQCHGTRACRGTRHAHSHLAAQSVVLSASDAASACRALWHVEFSGAVPGRYMLAQRAARCDSHALAGSGGAGGGGESGGGRGQGGGRGGGGVGEE